MFLAASEDGFSLFAWPSVMSSPASEDGFSLFAWHWSSLVIVLHWCFHFHCPAQG